MSNIWRDEDYFEVAVYYPERREYSIAVRRCRSLGEAMERREVLIREGYRNVHVRRVTVRTEPESMTAVQDVANVRRRG